MIVGITLAVMAAIREGEVVNTGSANIILGADPAVQYELRAVRALVTIGIVLAGT